VYVCLLYQEIELYWVCVFIVLEDRSIMGMCLLYQENYLVYVCLLYQEIELYCVCVFVV